MTTVVAASAVAGATVNADGELVLDGAVCCPACLEDKGSKFCCPKPAGAGATLFVAWSKADLAALRKELRGAPLVRVQVGGAA